MQCGCDALAERHRCVEEKERKKTHRVSIPGRHRTFHISIPTRRRSDRRSRGSPLPPVSEQRGKTPKTHETHLAPALALDTLQLCSRRILRHLASISRCREDGFISQHGAEAVTVVISLTEPALFFGLAAL